MPAIINNLSIDEASAEHDTQWWPPIAKRSVLHILESERMHAEAKVRELHRLLEAVAKTTWIPDDDRQVQK